MSPASFGQEVACTKERRGDSKATGCGADDWVTGRGHSRELALNFVFRPRRHRV
jgi:hypothetical protein